MSAPAPAAAAPDPLDVLVAALPGLVRVAGRTVVVKYGGNAMTTPQLQEDFAADVALLRSCGVRVVVVHGGGPQITRQLDRLGLPSQFRGGLRVTTPEAMEVVRMVLLGEVGPTVVGMVNRHGPLAVGLSGADGGLLTAERRGAVVDGEPVDVGLVGDVVAVRPEVLTALLDAGRVPVVATVAPGRDGQSYNVNADTAAAAVAVALHAEELLVLTDVAGLYADWPASAADGPAADVVDRIDADALAGLLPRLSAGMVPKMEACLRAVRGGVGRARVVDGREPHSLLRAVLDDGTGGTTVVPASAPVEVPA